MPAPKEIEVEIVDFDDDVVVFCPSETPTPIFRWSKKLFLSTYDKVYDESR